MRTAIKSKELCKFLKDFEQSGETYLLSEAKKKDELIEIAKKRGIQIEDSLDLGIFKTVYTFADKANDNQEIIPSKELLKALPTIIAKPVNIDHIARYIVGHYIDYKYLPKEKKVIAYGVFYKNAFDKEWEEAKKLIKAKKLATSHEIWSDKNKDEVLDNGDIVLHDLQIAGGAMIMKETPAFKDTKALRLSTKDYERYNRIKSQIGNFYSKDSNYRLVYACVNKDGLCTTDGKELRIAKDQNTLSTIQPQTENIKIVCQKCGYNFEKEFSAGSISEVKCPNCLSIVDKNGKVVYPEQVLNFNLSCTNCQSRNNWLRIGNRGKNIAHIRCLSCNSEYLIKLKEHSMEEKLINKSVFLRTGTVRCPQCGTSNDFSQPSNLDRVEKTCKKCDLKFSYKVGKNNKSKRDIQSIKELGLRKKSMGGDDKTKKNEPELSQAKKWSTRYVNDLPNSAFAAIEPAYKKGDTDDKNARHLPIKNKEGKIDLPHLRNALARVSQIKPITDSISKEELVKKAKKTLEKYRDRLETSKSQTDTVTDAIGKLAGLLKVPTSEITKNLKGVLDKMKAKDKKLEKSESRLLLEKAVKKIRKSKKEAKLSTAKVEKYTKGLKKFVGIIRDLKDEKKDYEKAIAKLEKEKEEASERSLSQAKKIVERKGDLGDFEHDLSDKELLDDTKYELAIAKKKLAEYENGQKKKKVSKASLNVGDEPEEADADKDEIEGIRKKAWGSNYKSS